MKPKRSSRLSSPNSSRKPLGLTLIGAGLILIGVTIPFLFSKSEALSGLGDQSLRPVPMNQPAPELTLQDLEGRTVSLADYRGQVVLVNNWATWCPPCRAEMPVLEAYYQAHRRKGFVILAVEAGDPPEEVSAFVAQYGLSFPVLLDPEGRSLVAFGNPALPNTYVIDRQGRIRLAWTGPVDRKALETYLTPLLEE
ncbi:MAG: TlpA disulfide reductase family protein [Anaerolineales bacterium]|nr:TlpA family protein disulfide reductase [Anaerolineales bacterium]MCS7249021.1 TlpA family protein disulfide reductase [Anaerolineales bacterium]MDW8162834.1 TlpA disulfide reductase family protein [Anaerolineales bacterium]MDW8446339.1 TlpA disulfide reductase family protein [Anaerolineales bacterium]